MPPVRIPGIIGATGQSRPAFVAVGMIVGGGFLQWVAPHLWPSVAAAFPLDFAGALIIIAGIILGCWRVRCPSCGDKWVLRAMRTQPFQSWADGVLYAHSCPACGKEFKTRDAAA